MGNVYSLDARVDVFVRQNYADEIEFNSHEKVGLEVLQKRK